MKRELECDSLHEAITDDNYLIVENLRVGYHKVSQEFHVLEVLNRLNTILDHAKKVWKHVLGLDSWDEVSITSHSLECVD